jgi:hypothetical protein
MIMTTATATWPASESNPQRMAILHATDRPLAGTPWHSSGNLSIAQLAVEAQVKYWVVAQRHTDLRDHFQSLVRAADRTAGTQRRVGTEKKSSTRNIGYATTAPDWNKSCVLTPP